MCASVRVWDRRCCPMRGASGGDRSNSSSSSDSVHSHWFLHLPVLTLLSAQLRRRRVDRLRVDGRGPLIAHSRGELGRAARRELEAPAAFLLPLFCSLLFERDF